MLEIRPAIGLIILYLQFSQKKTSIIIELKLNLDSAWLKLAASLLHWRDFAILFLSRRKKIVQESDIFFKTSDVLR